MIKNIEQLKGSGIVSVIERYIPLRKNGANYIANCPFHNEKSPSFVVSEHKEIFKCFGCGKSGDVINFIQEYEKIDFNEALKRLSELTNIPLEYDSAKSAPKNPSETLEKINALCVKNLAQNQQILNYLATRGLTKELMQKYEIGLTPSKQELLNHIGADDLKACNFASENLGIAMHHRITIAIRNPQHKLIAFVARTHPHYNFQPNAPKYINSKESYFYKKAQILYLLSHARSKIQAQKCALVVEGYIDCILLHQHAHKNAVATGGTAFNIQHLNALLKLDCKVIFCFDNDKSGMQANYRALKVCFNAGFYNTEVLLLKNRAKNGRLCKDINEALLNAPTPSTQATEQTPAPCPLNFKTLSGFEFFIKYLYKNTDKKSAFKEIKETIKACSNFYDKQSFLDTASKLTSVPQNYFTDEMLPKTKEQNYSKFCASILHSKECAYIASELDLSFLPKELENSLKAYIHTGKTAPNLAEFIEVSSLDNERFYRHYCDLYTAELEKQREKAKARKDLALVIALGEKIKQMRENIKSTKAF